MELFLLTRKNKWKQVQGHPKFINLHKAIYQELTKYAGNKDADGTLSGKVLYNKDFYIGAIYNEAYEYCTLLYCVQYEYATDIKRYLVYGIPNDDHNTRHLAGTHLGSINTKYADGYCPVLFDGVKYV